MKKFFLLTAIVFTHFTFACTCSQPSVKEAYNYATDVFIGKVLSANVAYQFTGRKIYTYDVEVLRDFKIGSGTSRKCTFFSEGGNGTCEYLFNVGITYLIYTDSEGKGILNHTNTCLRTSPIIAIEHRNNENELGQLKLLHEEFQKKDLLQYMDNYTYISLNEHNNLKNKTEALEKKFKSELIANEDLKLKEIYLKAAILVLLGAVILFIVLYLKSKKTLTTGKTDN